MIKKLVASDNERFLDEFGFWKMECSGATRLMTKFKGNKKIHKNEAGNFF